MLDVARHLRRLAQDDLERNIDRLVAEMAIVDDQTPLPIRPPDHCKRATLTLADSPESIEIRGQDREHVTFLRLIAPYLAGRHAGLFGWNFAKLDRAARVPTVDQLRQRVRQSAGADVVDRQNRICGARLPAAVDHLLRAPLDLRVAALYRIEVEIGEIDTGRHRRCGAAAHADQHPRPAELNEHRAFG